MFTLHSVQDLSMYNQFPYKGEIIRGARMKSSLAARCMLAYFILKQISLYIYDAIFKLFLYQFLTF